VNGWILLDGDPASLEETLDAAARFGVNHIELSHGLIMNIEDILGDGKTASDRVATLNKAIDLAHARGMKTYIWAHEISPMTIDVCYEPGGEFWAARGAAYREGLGKLPGLDGVVMMFGSAPTPPWFTTCTCNWCERKYPEGGVFDTPPVAEKIRLITENLGAVVTGELGRELVMRIFIHEPAEIAWHRDGLNSTKGIEYLTMAKSDVQDWQPYNPFDPNLGAVEGHPTYMELDVAGEYYGVSELPFASPGYFRYRLAHMFRKNGAGAAIRVSRGSSGALGTPNEANIYAMSELVKDGGRSLDAVWDGFIAYFYGVGPGSAEQPGYRRVLEDTFHVRLKSHYVLGIWALNKNSDIPSSAELGEFRDRGYMPKWDPRWKGVWDGLDKPGKAVVHRIWQEGTEAMELSAADLALFGPVAAKGGDRAADLLRRLRHQAFAARTWRAVKLFIWSDMALGLAPLDADYPSYMAWAHAELAAVSAEMEKAGLGGVSLASPSDIAAFVKNTAGMIQKGAVPAAPAVPVIHPVSVVAGGGGTAGLRFSASAAGRAYVDYGPEMPEPGSTIDAGEIKAETDVNVTVSGLEPGGRYFVRVRLVTAAGEITGGDWWIFMP
jgi:hypothetical protein